MKSAAMDSAYQLTWLMIAISVIDHVIATVYDYADLL
jgi:hypothetical protein